MIDSRIVATDGKWRLVRQEEGERVTHVLEKQDGFDALGCERWREVDIGSANTLLKSIFTWMTLHALKCPLMKEQADHEHRLSVSK